MHLDSILMPFLMAPITSSNSINKLVFFGGKLDFFAILPYFFLLF